MSSFGKALLAARMGETILRPGREGHVRFLTEEEATPIFHERGISKPMHPRRLGLFFVSAHDVVEFRPTDEDRESSDWATVREAEEEHQRSIAEAARLALAEEEMPERAAEEPPTDA